jgi:hypothetical protein
MARWALQEAGDALRQAAAQMAPLVADATAEQRPWLALTRDRLAAFACVLENARCVIVFQYLLSTDDQPRYGANVWDFDDNVMYDQRALQLRRVAREDLDNTAALLRLLEQAGGPVLTTTARPEDESVFVYGPHLPELLRHKMRVMTAHWHDFEALFPTSRFYEYEPALLTRPTPAQPES